jgi:glycine C-acetyltransferase
MTDAPARARARNPLAFLDAEIEELKAKGLYRRLRVVESEQKSRCVIDGREVITLSSNNYLGLNTHPKLKAAALDAVERYGAGSGAVRTIAGTMSLHEQLEARLAEFKHTEAVLTFQSGFTCNTGVIPILAPEGAVIVSDALNHASIIDGIRLTKAERKIFPHADMDALRNALRELRRADAHRTILVITDGVFSMDGDIAKLPEIVEAAEEAEAIVYVDDAHSSGVLGRNGRGSIDHFDLNGRVQVQVGTLSKAIGVLGGYVAGPANLRTVLEHKARPFLFSTSHPPAVAAACLAAIEVLETEPQLIDRLWENARYFKAGLQRLGFDTGNS